MLNLGGKWQKSKKPKVVKPSVINTSVKWIFYDQLLGPVLVSEKKINSIGSTECDLECSIFILENKPPPKKSTLKKFIAERKLKLLSKCAESMAHPPPDKKYTKMPHFTLFL